jgi:hypothetical protein
MKGDAMDGWSGSEGYVDRDMIHALGTLCPEQRIPVIRTPKIK